MDRIEPRHDPDLQSLTFRSSPRWSEPTTDGRFSIGIAVFLSVALVYPWYSYWVQKHLLARDMNAGVEELTEAVATESRDLDSRLAQRAQESAEVAQRRRIGAVRVTGISDGQPPLAVVDLGKSTFLEADETICRQTAAWLRRSVSGTVIRVQRLESHGTAAAIREMVCP